MHNAEYYVNVNQMKIHGSNGRIYESNLMQSRHQNENVVLDAIAK